MLELYEFPPTRSQRARWVLAELGLDYKSFPVNLAKGEQHHNTYRNLHPLGVVPALRTQAYTLLESVAIILQLIDENPEKNLAPALGTPARAHYYQWCVFACAEMDPAIIMYFDNTMRPLAHMNPPGTPHNPVLAEQARRVFAARAEMVSEALEERPFLLGDEFSGADIAVGHCCFMANFTGLIQGYPILERYFDRLKQRPAYQRAYPSA